jgi:hypothetical protein
VTVVASRPNPSPRPFLTNRRSSLPRATRAQRTCEESPGPSIPAKGHQFRPAALARLGLNRPNEAGHARLDWPGRAMGWHWLLSRPHSPDAVRPILTRRAADQACPIISPSAESLVGERPHPGPAAPTVHPAQPSGRGALPTTGKPEATWLGPAGPLKPSRPATLARMSRCD